MQDSRASFWEHAEELRLTLIKVLIIIVISVAIALLFYKPIFKIIKSPLDHPKKEFTVTSIKRERWTNFSDIPKKFNLSQNNRLIEISEGVKPLSSSVYQVPPYGYLEIDKLIEEPNGSLVILTPFEGIMAILKTCFWVGLCGSSPLWIYLILKYIAPAFNQNIGRLLFPFLALSLLMISLGILFAFYVTIPIANNYLEIFNKEIGINLWSLSSYLDYTICLCLANGLSFEIFIILFFLLHLELIDPEALCKKRRHHAVLAFFLGAILTPPDIVTQILFALPLLLIFEIAIFYGRCKKKVGTKKNATLKKEF